MSMKHIGTKILAGVLVVLLAGAGVLDLAQSAGGCHRACRSRRRPFGRSRRCSRTPQRPCAWRAILWRTCRLSRMRGTAKRMISRTCSRMQGGITRLRITQRPVMETTFNGPPYSGYPQFCAPDAAGRTTSKRVGFDLLSTASNHSHGHLVQRPDAHARCAGRRRSGPCRHLPHTAGARHGEDHRRRRHPTRHARLHLRHERPAGGQRAPVLRQRLHERLHDRTAVRWITTCMHSRIWTSAGQSGADAIAVYVHWGNEYAHRAVRAAASSWRTTCLRTVRHWCSAATSHVPQPMELRDAAGRPHRLSVLLSRQPDLQPVRPATPT